MVIAARDDVVTPPYYSEQLGRLIPGAETVILPQGGHFFPRVFPDAYRETVLNFLERKQTTAPRA
jgi:aminoacrylate hydrolase